MPTYNGERYIKQQIESILCQLESDDELIISDDGSTDLTLDIINGLKDKRIIICHHEKIKNPYHGHYKTIFAIGRNVENAVKQTRGDYIFLSDQDDIWLPNRIKSSIEKLQSCDLVLNNCSIINKERKIIKKSYFDEYIHPSTNLLRTIYKSSFHGCCMAFNKKLKQDIIPFPNIPIGHDTWIGLIAIKNYSIDFIYEPTILYRIHDKNITISDNFTSNNSLFFKICYRLAIIKAYLSIEI
jgi:glycosyltransferase involved in cell wall biosynthesis